jgi:aspartyl-tRNA(Asn)/glutamyl-tRNA(Gln) amidotransferase subunit C
MAEKTMADSLRITREDVLKLGQISNISISESEIEPLIEKLQAVLSYASYLKEVAAAYQPVPEIPKPANVVRPDEVISTPAEPLLALAPQREENYFVVPVILKN